MAWTSWLLRCSVRAMAEVLRARRISITLIQGRHGWEAVVEDEGETGIYGPSWDLAELLFNVGEDWVSPDG